MSQKKPAVEPDDTWMDSTEAAAAIGVTRGTLAQWRYERRGPRHYKPGRIRYRRSDVLAWLESRAVEPLSQKREAS